MLTSNVIVIMYITNSYFAMISTFLILRLFIVFFRLGLSSFKVGGFLPANGTSNTMPNALETREDSFASR